MGGGKSTLLAIGPSRNSELTGRLLDFGQWPVNKLAPIE